MPKKTVLKKPAQLTYLKLEALKSQLGIEGAKKETTNHPAQPIIERFADGSFEVSANTLSSSERIIAARIKQAFEKKSSTQKNPQNPPYTSNPFITKPFVQTQLHTPPLQKSTTNPNIHPTHPLQITLRKRFAKSFKYKIHGHNYFASLNGANWAVKGMTTTRGLPKVITEGIKAYFGKKLPNYIASEHTSQRTIFALVKNLEANHVTPNQLLSIHPEFIEGAFMTGYNSQSRLSRVFYIAVAIKELKSKGLDHDKLYQLFKITYGSVENPTAVMVKQWSNIHNELKTIPPTKVLLQTIDKKIPRIQN